MERSSEPFPFITYHAQSISKEEMRLRTAELLRESSTRRSIREFSDTPVESDLIRQLVAIAGTAPSGANKQPWSFCVVENPAVKREIRLAAEAEEMRNYNGRMSEEWLRDLAPLGTDEHKPFLEKAPVLIVVFKRLFEFEPDGSKHQNYYVNESVGLACGMLIHAIHHAGLCCLTHTPSPMNFLEKVLGRPSNERAFLLIPVGYPADSVSVPDIRRKKPEEICFWYS